MKSEWPGVSIRLTVVVRQSKDTTADRIVMPRWRSSTMLSVWVSPASTLPGSSSTPASKRMRSVRLVLPASTCATIPRLSVRKPSRPWSGRRLGTVKQSASTSPVARISRTPHGTAAREVRARGFRDSPVRFRRRGASSTTEPDWTIAMATGWRCRAARRARRGSGRASPPTSCPQPRPARSAVRVSRRTGWPTWSSSRRTIRLRPSWITSSTIELAAAALARSAADETVTGPSSSVTPVEQLLERGVGDVALDLGDVGLVHLVRRVGQPLREVAVVGQQDQPGGVGVEPADVEEPLGPVGDQVRQRAPALAGPTSSRPRRGAC